MEPLPDEVVKVHILPLLYEHEIFLFRSVCKSFRRISLEDFAYIKKRTIVCHIAGMPRYYNNVDRNEAEWRTFLYWRRVAVLDKEWNKIYPEIGALTPHEWVWAKKDILIDYPTGKIVLPDTRNFWWIVAYGQEYKDYRLSLPGVKNNVLEIKSDDEDEDDHDNLWWNLWHLIWDDRFPIDAVPLTNERKYVTREDMIKYLEEHWEIQCNRYQTEINAFRRTLGLDDILVSLKL